MYFAKFNFFFKIFVGKGLNIAKKKSKNKFFVVFLTVLHPLPLRSLKKYVISKAKPTFKKKFQ